MTARDDEGQGGGALHVKMIERRWAVVRFGAGDALSSHDRKQDAVAEARRIAARDGLEVVVFDLGGRTLPPGSSDLTTP